MQPRSSRSGNGGRLGGRCGEFAAVHGIGVHVFFLQVWQMGRDGKGKNLNPSPNPPKSTASLLMGSTATRENHIAPGLPTLLDLTGVCLHYSQGIQRRQTFRQRVGGLYGCTLLAQDMGHTNRPISGHRKLHPCRPASPLPTSDSGFTVKFCSVQLSFAPVLGPRSMYRAV